DLQARRKLLQLERRAEPALDRLLARDVHPQHQRDGDRQQLQPEMTERPDHVPHVYCTRDSPLRAGPARRCSTSDRSRGRSSSVPRPRSIWPSKTSEPFPASSETTTATASFSSVRPMAARWREPSSLLILGLIVSGRKQAAAATRSFCTIAAPSCNGDVRWKMLSSRS